MLTLNPKPEELEAIRGLSKESDRAAAIIAGSILEDRLQTRLQSFLRQPDPSLPMIKEYIKDLFRVSGPLGTFGVKIRIGFLMGLYGSIVCKELETIKDIRNAFAHKLTIRDFNDQWVKNKVKNLNIVENYVLSIEEFNRLNAALSRPGAYGSDDRETLLAAPKLRFLEACAAYGNLFMISPFLGDVPKIEGDDERAPLLRISGERTLEPLLQIVRDN